MSVLIAGHEPKSHSWTQCEAPAELDLLMSMSWSELPMHLDEGPTEVRPPGQGQKLAPLAGHVTGSGGNGLSK